MAEKQVFQKDKDGKNNDQPGESTSDAKLKDDPQDAKTSTDKLPSILLVDSEPGTSGVNTAKDVTEHSQPSRLMREMSIQLGSMLKLVENASDVQAGNAMLTMMSKEMLYPILKAVALMYPEWLAENQHKMSPNLFQTYCHQYALISETCDELEMDNETDPQAIKARSEKILDLVHQIQDCCQPPKELTSRVSSSYLQDIPTGIDLCLIM